MSKKFSEEKLSNSVNAEKITFNLIYVKGIVKSLLPFLRSLLKHSDCKYRLVSNACTSQEEKLLKEISQHDDRLSFYSLNTSEMIFHHDVLKHLLEMEQSPYFAMMDTDILATGSFLDEWLKSLSQYDAVFTGLPMWHEPSEMSMDRDFNIMGGRFWRAHNDFILGMTYGAIYRTESLKNFIRSSGIGFDRFHWEEIPEEHQQKLSSLDLKKEVYDTAKVLNILWQHDGATATFIPFDNIIHLGGASGPDTQKGLQTQFRETIDTIRVWSRWVLRGHIDNISLKERLNMLHLRKKRRFSGFILKKLLQTEVDNHSITQAVKVFEDPELRKKIAQGVMDMKQELKELSDH